MILRPLLLQKLDIRVGCIRLLHLQLHRHLPEQNILKNHKHRFSQSLLYLSGRGILRFQNSAYDVRPGTLALIPPAIIHEFRETWGQRPLTLALHFMMPEITPRKTPITVQLRAADLNRLRAHLAALSRIKHPTLPGQQILAASEALAILEIQLRTLGLTAGTAPAQPHHVTKFLALLKAQSLNSASLSELAAKVGYQPDYLNRKIRQATGLTLRQQRDALRLERARSALSSGLPVHEAAEQAGFTDPSYFARWFKRQTGLSPSRWHN
jgi:AraC family transcriptional activator of pobA